MWTEKLPGGVYSGEGEEDKPIDLPLQFRVEFSSPVRYRVGESFIPEKPLCAELCVWDCSQTSCCLWVHFTDRCVGRVGLQSISG